MIPYSKQTIDEDDIQSVVDALRSSHLTQGSRVHDFEQAICKLTTANYAAAVNSGTSALHIACLALGVGPQDCVWTSPLSFVASSNCALYCGASVDFIDVEIKTGNIDLNVLADKLATAKVNNSLPKVVIPVHLCGRPCDLEKLRALSIEYGFKIIEDACHALGATYKSSSIGSGLYSDISVFSFHAVKNITTAEGGIAVTSNREMADKMRLISSHGITKSPDSFVNENEGQWYHEQQLLGFNYRMNELSAALGLSQLNKFSDFQIKRQRAVDYYKNKLSDVCDWLGNNDPVVISANHLFVIQVDRKKRKSLFETLRNNNVWVQLHYMNIASQPFYQELGFNAQEYPNTNRVSEQSISLPLYSNITTDEQDIVIALIKQELCS